LKRIYSDDVLANLENYHNILKLNGIESTIKNEYLNLGIGGMGCCPELWVAECDVQRALEIIENTDLETPESQGTWVCFNCKEEIEGQFSECWSCGKPRN
jgi:hypothetical protein